MRRAILVVLILSLAGCAHEPAQPRFDFKARRTCLVLSVGGPAGVAHIGAIAALKEAHVPIDCVVGNSMGALVGSLYATAPGEDVDARFRAFVGAYTDATKREALRNGIGLGLIAGGVAAAKVGGKAAPALAFAGGAALGVMATEKLEHERMVRVLDEFFHGARIEAGLPMRFMTFYQEGTNTGVVSRRADSGPVAAAVGASVANPLIFATLAIGPGRPIDPGADRVSATPVQDACAALPGVNLLAINVSGQPIFTDATMKCPLLEVRIDPQPVAPQEVMELGDAYRRVVEGGRAATRAALARL
ncbi:MAG TPA: patatin-like phospholipase family protein [Polyangia bacterium]|nr:patatin-like phospholipase family protein [Polyangia bacterium]